MEKVIIIYFFVTILLVSVISAETPNIVIDIYNVSQLIGDTNSSTYNATYAGLINNASYLSTYNATYDAYITANQSNSSTWWNNLNTINTTQMENNGGTLNILESWLTIFVNSINNIIKGIWLTNNNNNLLVSNGTAIGYNETILNNSITNVGINAGFNSTYNATYEGSVNNESYLSTYNATYDGLINNASYLSTYNSTYDTYVTLNYTNKSNNWDDMNTINSTQITNSGGVFTILESWLTSFGNAVWCKLTGCTISGNLNVTGNVNATGNITTNTYFKGQPITGAIGSGIIWANGTNSYAEVNVNCSGTTCFWTGFKVRLVNTTNDEKYCDISNGSRVMTDNQHSVLYIDNNCAIQEISIQNYIAQSLNPGGIADFANIIFENGNSYDVNGIGIENKRLIKLRKLLLQTMHLNIINGFDRQLNTFPQFNITIGNYVYLMDVVSTSKIVTGTNEIEGIYHTGASTWQSADYYGLNTTWCDTGTGNVICTNTGKYRRVFIFILGYNETTDTTKLHQLLPSQNIYYNTLAECLDTITFPLTYTLPTFYQYGGVMLYAKCLRPSDTGWTGAWIDLRTVKQSTATGGTSTDIFLTKDGNTPLTGNWQVGGYNITNATTFQGTNVNITGNISLGDSVITRSGTNTTLGINNGGTIVVKLG